MIDAGGTISPDNNVFIGKNLIGRYLWETGVRRIDYLLVSHPEDDHIAGLPFLEEAFPLEKIYSSELHCVRLEREATLFSGNSFVLEGVHHQVFWPMGKSTRNGDLNDRSLVVLLTYGNFKILFTGDISAASEKKIMENPELGNLTVLKVAHHGSGSSTCRSFLETTSPEAALISAGRSNPFGHPSPQVLERLQASGTRIYTTPELGSLKIITNGKDWSITPCGGRP